MAPNRSDNFPLRRRGYLGFGVDAVPSSPHLAHERSERWIVTELDEKCGAAGLMRGDDVVAINGSPIESLAMLRAISGQISPGDSCELRVMRGATIETISLLSRPMPLERLNAGRIELDEVAWQHKGETHRLRAIWTHPLSEPRAVVWFLPSAAWISQEVPLDPADPTFQLIDFFTRHGVATLRVDRSGLGDSEGPSATTLDFEAEFSMWEAGRAHFLEKYPDLQKGLFGRSLGGMLAPLIAQNQPFDSICAWGTSSLNWHEASLESLEHQLRLKGFDGEPLRLRLEPMERLQRLVYLDGLSPGEAKERHPELARLSPDDYQGEFVFGRNHAFFSQLEKRDVAQAWREVGARVLGVSAEFDIIVPERALLRLTGLVGARSRFEAVSGVDHFLHERASLKEAVQAPWGGTFSTRAAQTLLDFFLTLARAP